jgi:hypothetical protein
LSGVNPVFGFRLSGAFGSKACLVNLLLIIGCIFEQAKVPITGVAKYIKIVLTLIQIRNIYNGQTIEFGSLRSSA